MCDWREESSDWTVSPYTFRYSSWDFEDYIQPYGNPSQNVCYVPINVVDVLYSVQVRYETDHEPDVPSCQFMIPTQNVQIDFYPQALENGTFEFHHPTGEGFPIFFLPLCISYQANHFVLKNPEAVRSVTLCGSLFCDRKNALSYFCNLKSMIINHEFQLQNFSTSTNFSTIIAGPLRGPM